jgi:uncharacterized membrane-anchored protein
MGESTSDYVVFQVDPYVAVVLGFVGLIASLILQLTVKRFIPWVYWLTVVMVAVFGTMAADVVHVVLGVPYVVSTLFFSLVLLSVFLLWWRIEGTLSIHTIKTRSRELFYWATVIATFALGTAAGDFTASSLSLGYLPSLLLFAVLFAAPLLARKLFGAGEVFTFWFAYVVTRPLGASFADWMGKDRLGGLGIGDGKVALALALLIVLAVVIETLRFRKVNR